MRLLAKGFPIVGIFQKLTVAAVSLGLFVFVLVMAVRCRRAFRARYRTGLLIGFLCFALALPGSVFYLMHLDLRAFDPGGRLPPSAARSAFVVAVSAAAVVMVLRIGWSMLVYVTAAAQWEGLRPGLFRGLGTGESRLGRLWLPAVVGAGAGLFSVGVFSLLGVSYGEGIRQMREMLRPEAFKSSALCLLVAVTSVTGVAIAEELLFRGALFGTLLRAFSRGERRSGRAIAVAILIVSGLWALAHLNTTDAPLLKCVQIFALGIVLCEFARRRSLEAAIAAHVALNATAVLAGAAIETWGM